MDGATKKRLDSASSTLRPAHFLPLSFLSSAVPESAPAPRSGQMNASEIWRETAGTIGEKFEAVAARTPAGLAVADEFARWDYARLERVSRGIAQAIHTTGAGPHEVVGVFLPNGIAHVAAVLGVLRAGRIYVSLDPAYPSKRVRSMAKAAQIDRLVTSPELADAAAAFGLPVVSASDDSAVVHSGPMTSVSAGPESFAGLYFTSGSTGEPKVVAHTHRNVLFDIGRQTRDMKISEADRFDLLFSPSFSAFLSPVFGALLTGASVHVFALSDRPVTALRDWLEREAITVSTASVSLFRRLVGALPAGRSFPALRMLSLGAEPLRASDLEFVRDRFPPTCTLQNALATTETRTIAQSYWQAGSPLPNEVCVGHPVAGKELTLRDERDEPVPEGETGEIVIRSAFIAPGPWAELRRLPNGRLPAPRITTHRTGDLARQRTDGQIIHLGRKDAQLKLRGHRIEAGDVETHLLKHAAVRDAAVFIASESAGAGGHDRLIALWVRRENSGGEAVDLRGYVRGHLPDYMVPNVIVEVDVLPLTETGKLARSRLPETWQTHLARAEKSRSRKPAGERGETKTQSELWANILHVPTVGDDDDFFALGGDSLAATELMAALGRQLGWTPPATWLIEAPTLATFSRRIEKAVAAHPGATLRRVLLQSARHTGGRPLYLLPAWNHSALGFRDLARPQGGEREVWAIDGFDDAGRAPVASVTEIAQRVVSVLHIWHPDLAIDIGGHSMGGVLAWEVMRLIVSRGHVPGRVILIDSSRFYALCGERENAWIARTASAPGRLKAVWSLLRTPGQLPAALILQRVFLSKIEWWLWKRWRRAPTGIAAVHHMEIIQLSRTYAVPDQPAPVTLLRARVQSEWHNVFSVDLGWAPHCCDGFEIIQVPGNHGSMIRKPHAAALAERLGWLDPVRPIAR